MKGGSGASASDVGAADSSSDSGPDGTFDGGVGGVTGADPDGDDCGGCSM